MALENFKAPALPYPGPEYDREYINQLLSVLRIYFNYLDSDTPNKAYSYRADYFYGGQFIGDGFGFKLPHISASDSTDQLATGNNTPTIVTWDTLESSNGWTLASNAGTAQYAGVYTIRYSLQFVNTANTAHDATVWLRVNGSDVANSATIFTIPARKSAGVPSYVCGYSEATFTIDVGDEIELYWATDLAYDPVGPVDGVYILHDVAQVSPYARPAIPSAIGSISFVSAVP